MNTEIHTLMERGILELTKLPTSKKWVFKVKTNADGSLDKFKALLVAKGFTQIEGEDFYKIFTPVSDKTAYRMLLTIATVWKHAIIQMDVRNAVLCGRSDIHKATWRLPRWDL